MKAIRCKTLLRAIPVVFMFVFLTACGCEHEWSQATCVTLSTCTKCGKTQGELADHTWVEATCTSPRTCKVCQLTEGEALGHKWKDATCTQPETCSVCHETRGEALGHKWKEATCTLPKTCEICSTTTGDPLGHTVSEWTTTLEPTCYEQGEQKGVCEVCGEEVTERIVPLEHELGDVEIITPATSLTSGEKGQKCKRCGDYINTFSYELSAEEKEEAFKSECKKYSYDKIARTPDDYMLEQLYFRGEVIQVLEDGNAVQLRVNVTNTGYYWTDTIFVQYTRSAGEPRILEDDIIKIYGYGAGTVTYESVLGAQITIPAVIAQYIEY